MLKFTDCELCASRREFRLPHPAGRAGGACTSTILEVLYSDEEVPGEDYSFIDVLEQMRHILRKNGFPQVPQLTSSNPCDIREKFSLVPPECYGTRRAVLIGINYVGHNPGQLTGCHNDVFNMV